MPHRVATFFRSRSSSNDLDLSHDIVKNLRNPSFGRKSPSPAERRLSPVIQPQDASCERTTAIMPDNHKRMSLSGALHTPKSSSKSIPLYQPAKIDISIESPPIVFYGAPNASTGALFSGKLNLTVTEDHLEVDKFTLVFFLDTLHKKPFHAHCAECAQQTAEIFKWTFVAGPTKLKKGNHEYVFSHLLSGHLPATTKGPLVHKTYGLKALLDPKPADLSKPAAPITFHKPIDVKRAICAPELPRYSIRIFPPTNLTANVELPQVIHPIGESPVLFRLNGVVFRRDDRKTQIQWKVKRLTWKIEETQKSASPACARHGAKAAAAAIAGGSGSSDDVEAAAAKKRSTPHEDVRTIGGADLKSGWKADYSTPDGTVEMEFPIGVRPADAAAPVCGMRAEDGSTEVSHVMVVEVIVAEEFAPVGRPRQVTPTGSARVLRMQFGLQLTERAGMGISWDEEQPPLYENVPASPPAYATADLCDVEELENYNLN